MARSPSAFKQRDVTRALKAARAAGLDISCVEIHPRTGNITIRENSVRHNSEPDAFDQWKARHADQA